MHDKIDCGLRLLVAVGLYSKEIAKNWSEILKIRYNNSMSLELTTTDSLTIRPLTNSKSACPDPFFPYCISHLNE